MHSGWFGVIHVKRKQDLELREWVRIADVSRDGGDVISQAASKERGIG